MAITSTKATATRIGVDHCVGAILTEGPDGTPTYSNLTTLPGLVKLSVNPNGSVDTIFYDDGPGDTAASLGKIDVEIEKNALSTAERAFILGHGIDANGSLVYGGGDVPPWMAIGFRTLKSNGKYRYVWLYKGKFVDPEETNETKGESVSFQTDTIKGQFVKLDKTYEVDGRQVQPYKIELDEEHDLANAVTIGKWFEDVVLPSTVKDVTP